MSSIEGKQTSAAEREAAIRQKLVDASANFSKGMVTTLNWFYEKETTVNRIYVMNRQAIVDANKDGTLAKHNLDLDTEFERLLVESTKAEQAARSHLALEIVRLASQFAKETEVV